MTKIRQWSIVTVVAVLVVLVAGWFFLVKPQHSKVSSLKASASAQDQSNQLLETKIASLQAEQRSLPQQQQALQKFTTEVPNNASEPTIIRQLSASASAAGVDLVSMTPGAPSAVVSPTAALTPTATTTPAGSTAPAAGSTSLAGASTAAGELVQLPIAIAITGSYANVESFFQSLERLPRALLVTGWSLCPDVTGGAAAATTTGSSGATCTLPTTASNKTLPAGTIGGTLDGIVFYNPPVGTVTSGLTTLQPTTTTPTTTTPTATTPSTAPTPTAATSAPAN